MLDEIKSGDIVAFSKRESLRSVYHLAIAAPVWGEHLLYEAWMGDGRLPCIRSGRENPQGVQAHKPGSLIDKLVAWHVPLVRFLYPHEEDRLLPEVDEAIGHGREFLAERHGVVQAGPHWDSEYIALALTSVGLLPAFDRPGRWKPRQLVRELVRRGIYRNPVLIK